MFSFAKDSPYLDEEKVVFPEQKPIAFMMRLVELFTVEEDWIFDESGGLGKE